MRLLNTLSLELEHFHEHNRPKYAILSHTWEDGEVLFADIQNGPKKWYEKKGSLKLVSCAGIAAQAGFRYIWIDTCCIDKNSSAELSEAINLMFKWYQESAVCFAFLSDVRGSGLSLQELIAPPVVEFYDGHWQPIGSRRRLADLIHATTKIDLPILYGNDPSPFKANDTKYQLELETYSIHTKMNWACGRQTTREEDEAYSLMGIFGVNMPLIYGEGGIQAFMRLQEVIIKRSNDQSILVNNSLGHPLVQRPSEFKATFRLIRSPAESKHSLQTAKYGVDVSLLLYPLDNVMSVMVGIVESSFEDDVTGLARPAIILKASGEDAGYYRRSGFNILRVRRNLHGRIQVVDNQDERKIIVSSLDQDRLTRKVVRIYSSAYEEYLGTILSPVTPKIYRLYLRIRNVPLDSGIEYAACYPKPHESILLSSGIPLIASTRLIACVLLRPLIVVLITQTAHDMLEPAAIHLHKWGKFCGIEPPIVGGITNLDSAHTALQLDRWSDLVDAGIITLNRKTPYECLMGLPNEHLLTVRVVKTLMLENVVHRIEIESARQPGWTTKRLWR